VPNLSKAGFGVVAHEVGTLRMPVKDGAGVVDENLQVNGVDNLYVCDLSVFPVSPAANPTLTLAALAQRLGNHLLDRD
jgi:choline dehydrogenase-like flavoprotein